MKHQRQQKLDFLPTSDEGSLLYLKGTEEDAEGWTGRLDQFLAREREKIMKCLRKLLIEIDF